MGLTNSGEFKLSKPIYVCYAKEMNGGKKPYSFLIKKIRGICIYEGGEYEFISTLTTFSTDAVRSILESGEKIHGLSYVKSKGIIRVLQCVAPFNMTEPRTPSNESLKSLLVALDSLHKESNLKLVLAGLKRGARKEVKEAGIGIGVGGGI